MLGCGVSGALWNSATAVFVSNPNHKLDIYTTPLQTLLLSGIFVRSPNHKSGIDTVLFRICTTATALSV